MKLNNRLLDLDRLLDKSDEPSLMSIISGKGGAGKSVIAYNLADSLAVQGIRTLLVDADWNFGNLHILANLIPKTSLYDITEGRLPAVEAATKLKSNLDLIIAPSAIQTGIEFNVNRFARFIENIRNDFRSYDLVLFDTPTGQLELLKIISAASDLNLFVINPELTSIANNFGLLKLLIKSNNQLNSHIFVNRADSGKDSEYIYRKLAALAGRYLKNVPFYAGYLYVHQSLIESSERQKTLREADPESPLNDQFSTLCNFVTEELLERPKNNQTKASTSINSEIIFADIKDRVND
ncbi:MAG: MinD/ParA family protein [candidate division Zixibacteria bacterium]|nr:MinD/ParA family protein [candidate division Zixibacteria bacterium]